MLNRPIIITLMILSAATCITSAQDCLATKIHSAISTSCFNDNGNGTINDTATTLMWKRCAEGMTWNDNKCSGSESHFSWLDAQQHIEEINKKGYAGFSDWYIPNTKEYQTIAQRWCNYPSMNIKAFLDTSKSVFWSGPPVADDSSNTWYVDFGNGYDYWNYHYYNLALRLVRNMGQ